MSYLVDTVLLLWLRPTYVVAVYCKETMFTSECSTDEVAPKSK